MLSRKGVVLPFMSTKKWIACSDTKAVFNNHETQHVYRVTDWHRKKWTTVQFVNMIYINCCSTMVDGRDRIHGRERINILSVIIDVKYSLLHDVVQRNMFMSDGYD